MIYWLSCANKPWFTDSSSIIHKNRIAVKKCNKEEVRISVDKFIENKMLKMHLLTRKIEIRNWYHMSTTLPSINIKPSISLLSIDKFPRDQAKKCTALHTRVAFPSPPPTKKSCFPLIAIVHNGRFKINRHDYNRHDIIHLDLPRHMMLFFFFGEPDHTFGVE
mmetsp:Transcript_1440/g.3024  ORF Transcript_1440/g.3024 Transcript_1440/m.3024 type:complete len:163 (+) Transcript_1440:1151-1639(+)